MMRLDGVLGFTLILAVLSACGTPMKWVKPGVDPTQADTDRFQCEAAARRESALNSPNTSAGFGIGTGGGGVGFGFGIGTSIGATYDQNDVDRLTSFCLRMRGYEQVPAQ